MKKREKVLISIVIVFCLIAVGLFFGRDYILDFMISKMDIQLFLKGDKPFDYFIV